jgi:hypothetical protein
MLKGRNVREESARSNTWRCCASNEAGPGYPLIRKEHNGLSCDGISETSPLLTAIISSIAEGRKAAIVITVRWAVGVAETGRRDWLTMTGLICVCAGVGRWRAVCITTTSASWLETKDIDFTEIHNTWQIVDWKVETPFDWLRKRHALTIHLHSVTYTDDLESTCGRSAQRMKETIQD